MFVSVDSSWILSVSHLEDVFLTVKAGQKWD